MTEPTAPSQEHRPPREASASNDYFRVYLEYNKSLRIWLISYGIGAQVLIATSEPLADVLRTQRCATWVVGLFLTGVLLQVLIAFINKVTNWYAYARSEPERTCSTPPDAKRIDSRLSP